MDWRFECFLRSSILRIFAYVIALIALDCILLRSISILHFSRHSGLIADVVHIAYQLMNEKRKILINL